MSTTNTTNGSELALAGINSLVTGSSALIDKNDITTIIVAELEHRLDQQYKENEAKRTALTSRITSLNKLVETETNQLATAASQSFIDSMTAVLESNGFLNVSSSVGLARAYTGEETVIPFVNIEHQLPPFIQKGKTVTKGSSTGYELPPVPITTNILDANFVLKEANEELQQLTTEAGVIRRHQSDMPKIERQARAKVALASLKTTDEGQAFIDQILASI